ncbi:MAG: gamma carbonic anhydrase family protein [Candidatus Acidiferrales bacterium]
MIRNYRGHVPRIAPSAYVDPQAVVIGDVVIGEHTSVWPCTVIRGDVHSIRIGARCSIQDGSVLHVQQHDEYPLTLGDNITVGHNVILHGCTIEPRCLIGMGSIILNGAKIGTGSIVAAGALIPERMEIPPGSVVMGQPGKIRRSTTAADLDAIDRNAQRYVEYAALHKAENSK